MGIVTEYFAAPDDATAATALDSPGGPGMPDACGLPRFDTVALPSVDPFVMLAGLAQALSGRPYGEITAHPRHGGIVASTGTEGPWVVSVTTELARDLAAAAPDRLTRAIRAWLRESEPPVPPRRLTAAVVQLSELSGRALVRGREVYCWTSLGGDP